VCLNNKQSDNKIPYFDADFFELSFEKKILQESTGFLYIDRKLNNVKKKSLLKRRDNID